MVQKQKRDEHISKKENLHLAQFLKNDTSKDAFPTASFIFDDSEWAAETSSFLSKMDPLLLPYLSYLSP